MSIRDEINNRLKEGRLWCLEPELPGDGAVRPIFLAKEVQKALEQSDSIYRFGELRAYLEQFLIGGAISVSESPYQKPPSTYLARTDPIEDDIWDIRSYAPNPAIRVLGAFSEKDHFVALCWEYRKELGGPRSKEWRDFIVRAKASWRQLFPTYPRFKGESVSEYLSSNYIVESNN